MARNGKNLPSSHGPDFDDWTLNEFNNGRSNGGELELELDQAQEKLWEQSMSKIINEMKHKLQLDHGDQRATGVQFNAIEEVMDKFVESKDFERALSYKGKKRNGRAARSGHKNQKADSPGGNRMRNGILQGKTHPEMMAHTSDKKDHGDVDDNLFGFDPLDEDAMTPAMQYQKSFLKRIPSVILEAHESIISQKNDEAPARKGMTQEDLTDFINQVHQESAQSCNSNSAAEDAYSSQNATSQNQDAKKRSSHQQQKFFEKSACFDVPRAEDVPADLFE